MTILSKISHNIINDFDTVGADPAIKEAKNLRTLDRYACFDIFKNIQGRL